MDEYDDYRAALAHLRLFMRGIGVSRHHVDSPQSGGAANRHQDVLVEIGQYLIAPRREFEWWRLLRFAAHGMRDICGMVRSYLECSAAAFTFDAGGEMWIMWRRVDGMMAYGRRGAYWHECVPVEAPAEYLRCELAFTDRIQVQFLCGGICYEDGIPYQYNGRYSFVAAQSTRNREFYVGTDPSCHRFLCHGIGINPPERYITVRSYGWKIYGMLSDGNVEAIRVPELSRR